MNALDIVRAWKDEDYRTTLTEAQRAGLPENPAGLVELHAADLDGVAGGKPRPTMPPGCPGSFQFTCTLRTRGPGCPKTLTVA